MAGISDDVENLRVNRQDFMSALDEVHPAFGVSEEELQQVIQNGIIHFDPVVDVCPPPCELVMCLIFAIGTPPRRRVIHRTGPHLHENAAR